MLAHTLQHLFDRNIPSIKLMDFVLNGWHEFCFSLDRQTRKTHSSSFFLWLISVSNQRIFQMYSSRTGETSPEVCCWLFQRINISIYGVQSLSASCLVYPAWLAGGARTWLAITIIIVSFLAAEASLVTISRTGSIISSTTTEPTAASRLSIR